jgi:hypothetical protein
MRFDRNQKSPFIKGVKLSLCLLVALVAPRFASAAIVGPYTPDASTLHLWHFDESATPCVDFATTGYATNLAYMINGATLGNASYSNSFVDFANCISFGTVAGSGAVIFPSGSGDVGNAIPFTYAGTNGAFTYEAMVYVGFNPSASGSEPCQIMDCDSDSATRVFQLRLDPVGFASGGRNTSVVGIEFINDTTTVAVPPIPTTGSNAIVSNAWFHVAVTYNGSANTTSNLLFYWTLLNSNATSANCIYGTNMTSSLPDTDTATTVFSVGNSARNPSGLTGADDANFPGKIDEVRISSVARAANQMLFAPASAGIPVITSQPSPTDQIVTTGAEVSYNVTATGPLLNYQWLQNGSHLLNATNSDFTIASASPSNSGNYDVVVTNSYGAVTSTVVSLTVTSLMIVTQPVSVVSAYASTATFDVVAVGVEPLFYQWYENGSAISGATNSTLTLTPWNSANAGNYDVVVSNSSGSVTSVTASLTLGGPPVSLTQVNDGDLDLSGYGYAGDSDINGVAFICSGLMTVSNQQFFAYYGESNTNSSYAYNGTAWIARRTVGSSLWQVFPTTFTPDNGITDGHDVVVFGIDGAGYMHLCWGMHDDPLNYARSTTPVTGSQPIVFGPNLGTMTGNETSVTYPQFLTMANGDLLFLYRVGESGGGNTFLNRWLLASQKWTNVTVTNGTAEPFIQGLWPTSYNAYNQMPCLDANGNLYLVWTWRWTPEYESNHNLLFAKSTNGGVTWLRFGGKPYDLPISQSGESGDTNTIAEVIEDIPTNYSLINQAGMCLDASNNPVIATWWAPGSGSGNDQRQYMVVFPDTNGVWQTRQISYRTNDPTNVVEEDDVVRDLGRPVVVCDQQNRIIVLYRDNCGSNGLTIARTLPYALDPERTNWFTFVLTTDNLGSYEPVIDLARWQRDNVMDIVYQASDGEGYTPPASDASPIGVLEWNAAAYFSAAPTLQFALTNSNQNAVFSWNSQPGWGYQLQWSTNLVNWSVVTTLNGIGGVLPLQYIQTNCATGPQEFWRLVSKEGGF